MHKTEIRDGSVVDDIRCALIPWFDPRSLAYKVADLFDGKPHVLRSRTWRCHEVLDQGTEGSCAGFAVAHDLIARPITIDVDAAFARETLYWEAQRHDGFRGGAYPGASHFNEGTSILAVMKVAKKLGYYSEYRWAFGIRDVLRSISDIGPVVLGLPWYRSMSEPRYGRITEATGGLVGRHAILARGQNLDAKRVLLHNSWGKDYGKDGTAWISIDLLDELLKNGEACVPVGRLLP